MFFKEHQKKKAQRLNQSESNFTQSMQDKKINKIRVAIHARSAGWRRLHFLLSACAAEV